MSTPTSTYANKTVSQQFVDFIAATAADELKNQIQRYMLSYAKFWGGTIQNAQGQQGSAFPSLSVYGRVSALGSAAVDFFSKSHDWSTFIANEVNAYITANGVPAASSTMSFILPYVKDGTFALPGVPADYTMTYNQDGTAAIAYVQPSV